MFTQETWKFINTFAPWFSALGTISAVILALYLARRDRNIRLEISAGHRIIVTPGVPAPYPEYLSIYVVNVGHREAQLTNIGWKTGIFKKQHAVQTPPNNEFSSPLPIRLKDGEEAKYLIPLSEADDWLKDFTEKMLTPFPKIQCRFAKVRAFTSIGKTFESKFEVGLREKIIEKYHAK